MVKKGDVLFEIDERPYKWELDRTEGVVLQMKGRLERLKADFARAQDLLPKNAISKEDYDKMRSGLAATGTSASAKIVNRRFIFVATGLWPVRTSHSNVATTITSWTSSRQGSALARRARETSAARL